MHREDCSDGRNETERERGGTTERGKTFGTVFAEATEAMQDEEQVTKGAMARHADRESDVRTGYRCIDEKYRTYLGC